MASTKINSMLLASADPERLRSWYVRALGPDSNEDQGVYGILGFGGFYLLIDKRDDVGERNPEPGRMIINFDVEDARATAAKLDELGVEWLAKLEDRDGSLFATAIDPDGNYVQIIQLSEAAKQSMS
ncbi:MAG: VOC family protein [Micromonosporaceae bacterium]